MPAPVRQRIKTFLTPKIEDFLIAETVDVSRISIPEYGAPHPDNNKYPYHKFCYATASDDTGLIDTFIYAMPRENQDDYNFEWVEADIGGQKYTAVQRTYVTLRDEFTVSTPTPGAGMPDVPISLFGTGSGDPRVLSSFVLAERRQTNGADKELNSLFVIDVHTYVKRCTHRVIRDDEATGSVLYVESNLYFGTESLASTTVAALFADSNHTYWDLTSAGLQREGQQLSCNWYLITTTQLVPNRTPVAITGTTSTGVLLRSYNTEKDYVWPAILRIETGAPTAFSANNDSVFVIISEADGGDNDKIFIRNQFSNPRYSGPTKMRVDEYWRATPLDKNADPFTNGGLPESSVMIPIEVQHSGANYNARIEPTLHAAFTFVDTIGSDNPTYDAGDYSQTYTATSPYTDWPESLIVSVDQVPFRGGYKITVITAFRPDHYVPVTP